MTSTSGSCLAENLFKKYCLQVVAPSPSPQPIKPRSSNFIQSRRKFAQKAAFTKKKPEAATKILAKIDPEQGSETQDAKELKKKLV